jgi:membrane protein DedA with SNARE-associated domain
MSGMEIDSLIASLGTISYGGLFLIALAANMIIPIPEEFILLVLGYLSGTGAFNFYLLAGTMITGMFISDIVLFKLSRHGNKYLNKLKKKISTNRLLKDEEWTKRHIKKIIFISRFLMQLRFIGPVLSGSVHTPWKTFLFYDFIALCIYVPFVLFLGDYFHSQLSQIIHGAGVAKNIILFVVGLLLFILLTRFIEKGFVRSITKKVSGYTKALINGIYIKNK